MADGVKTDEVLMLVKALPHVGERHGEMVCCAGVTLDRKWRRQFPIKFRELGDEKFKRWQWIAYDWREPGSDDRRIESQRVQEGTICARSRKQRSNGIITTITNN